MQGGFQRAPLWLQELVREFTKPPYFLQQKVPPTPHRTGALTPDGGESAQKSLHVQSQQDTTRRDGRTSGNNGTPSNSLPVRNTKPTFTQNGRDEGNGRAKSVAKSSPSPKSSAKPASKRAIVDEETRAWQAVLRQADNYRATRILLEKPKDNAAWLAINDRLQRAASLIL